MMWRAFVVAFVILATAACGTKGPLLPPFVRQPAAAEITAEGGSALALAGDDSLAADDAANVAATIDRLGRVDNLHNNVGNEAMGDPVSTTEEDSDRDHQVNLKGPFLN